VHLSRLDIPIAAKALCDDIGGQFPIGDERGVVLEAQVEDGNLHSAAIVAGGMPQIGTGAGYALAGHRLNVGPVGKAHVTHRGEAGHVQQ
jgi:hypothetical protein